MPQARRYLGKNGCVVTQCGGAGILFDSWHLGDLYGTTELGGANRAPCEDVGCGTVFELMPSGSGYQEAVLWSFGAPNDGALPGVGVVADASGALYGTTPVGGSGALLGTVFKVVP